ncbi:SEC-C metal-binding domain-containing protein [Hellea sp.]|nr:SEC-C metal-binding domain-containing protein [Hellea sp.]
MGAAGEEPCGGINEGALFYCLGGFADVKSNFAFSQFAWILSCIILHNLYTFGMNLAARPQKEVFLDLEKVCREAGFIHVLAALVFENNFHSVKFDEKFPKIQDQYDGKKLIRSELNVLHGLMLKGDMDAKPLNEENILAKKRVCYELLEELHGSYYSQAMRDGKLFTDSETLFSHPDIFRESIFYAADSSFYFQQHVFAIERYSKDNSWLEQNVGFTIDEAAHIAHAIITNTYLLVQTFQEGLVDGSKSYLEAFSISISELCELTGLADAKVRSFIKQFSTSGGYSNLKFNSVDDYNLAKSHPIILFPHDKISLLQTHSICESLYVSPMFWMQGDNQYKTKARTHRGNFLEQKITDRLKRVFGENNVFENVEIFKGKHIVGEIDVLVVYIDRLLIVQAKSKTLTLKAQQGSLKHLEDDFKKAIQNAYDQAYSCASEILEGGVRLQKQGGGSLDLPAEIMEIFPICAIADHYPSLYFQARQFLKTKTKKKIMPPYVMDVFLLDVISEFLTHPIRMLDYLNKRTQYNESVGANNDFAVFGYHLSNNLYKDPEYNMMMLNDDLAWEIDKAFISRRERGELDALPKGVLTKFQGTPYGDIIDYLEGFQEAGAVELGYLLLSYDGVSIDGINRGMIQLARAARNSDRTHDFTLGGPDGGITYHISQTPTKERLKYLLNHAEIRKYSTRANHWFALSGTVGSGEPVDTICFLKSRWKRSAKLDFEVSQLPPKASKLSRVTGRITVKLGRNDKCHCGSDVKYKKCCLRKDESHSQ